jgi:hypothetical protein
MAPWRWDVTKLVKPGGNRVEVLVNNTLANHYLTIPTRYRGSPVSGLIGPVAIELAVRLDGNRVSSLLSGEAASGAAGRQGVLDQREQE